MNREPLVTVASITSLVAAVLGLLVAFGVHLGSDNEKLILGLAAAVAPFIVAAFTRPRVTPVAPAPRRRDAAGESILYVALVVLVVLAIVFLVLGH